MYMEIILYYTYLFIEIWRSCKTRKHAHQGASLSAWEPGDVIETEGSSLRVLRVVLEGSVSLHQVALYPAL